jgi:type II secretory pathway pseudopilin PulG
MNANWKRFGGCNRKGLTLIEVIAGLLLMSTLLVGILTAGSRHMRQLRLAKQRLAAAAMADQLLTAWAQSEQNLAVGECDAPDTAGLAWRVRPVERPSSPESLGVEIVRLEVFDAKADPTKQPLISVDVLNQLREDDEKDRMGE